MSYSGTPSCASHDAAVWRMIRGGNRRTPAASTAGQREKAHEAKTELQRRGVAAQDVDTSTPPVSEPEISGAPTAPPEATTAAPQLKSPHLQKALELARASQEAE